MDLASACGVKGVAALEDRLVSAYDITNVVKGEYDCEPGKMDAVNNVEEVPHVQVAQ